MTKRPFASTERLLALATRCATMLTGYTKRQTEMAADPMVYGLMEAAFGAVARQHYIWMGTGSRPKRIDFRIGGNNPVVLEFALRPIDGTIQLYGSQNAAELRKLSRVPTSKARTRVLLLIDLYARSPHDRATLKKSYDDVRLGPGRFHRKSVQIIYANSCGTHFTFRWRPLRK